MCPAEGALPLSWILSFLNPNWSWVLNKVILKLQRSEFEGLHCPAKVWEYKNCPQLHFYNLSPLISLLGKVLTLLKLSCSVVV